MLVTLQQERNCKQQCTSKGKTSENPDVKKQKIRTNVSKMGVQDRSVQTQQNDWSHKK